MFFFQSMFRQVYLGITGSTTLSAVQTIAEGILLLCALFAVYEAYSRGGDARALALAGVRFLFMGLLLTQYPNVFINVNNAANNLAQQIAPTDVLTNFGGQVGNYLGSLSGQNIWFNVITGGVAATLSVALQFIAVVIFPITYTLFSFFYSMYGAILYVVGPLVLALYPAFGIGQIARTYMVNLLIWNSWGILYAVMSQLLTLMSAGSLTSILNAGTFGGFFQGASQMLLISLSSILLSLMVALIPFIAKRVVSGDVGSTMFAALGAATAALQAVGAGVSAMAGAMAGGGGPDKKEPPDGPGGGGQANRTSNTAADSSSSTAPEGPGDGGGGVTKGASNQSKTTGRGDGGGNRSPNPPRGGRNSEGYPIGLGPRNVLQLGLNAAPAMVGYAIGRAARAIRNGSNSSNQEE